MVKSVKGLFDAVSAINKAWGLTLYKLSLVKRMNKPRSADQTISRINPNRHGILFGRNCGGKRNSIVVEPSCNSRISPFEQSVVPGFTCETAIGVVNSFRCKSSSFSFFSSTVFLLISKMEISDISLSIDRCPKFNKLSKLNAFERIVSYWIACEIRGWINRLANLFFNSRAEKKKQVSFSFINFR